ncbi:MAG: hypothetical protein E7461_06930 [Ruminococcaceae bacterium]|nr:hypothetical protein [Oscillospiraceae bacterium]
MKRNLFAIFLALALVVALAFVAAPKAQAADVLTPANAVDGKITVSTAGQLLDLQGKELTVEIAEGIELSVIDSANTGLTGEGAGKLTFSDGNKGTVALEAEDEISRRFLKVPNEDGSFSFHPFYLTVKRVGINTNKSALCLQAMFVSNEIAQKAISTGIVYGDTELTSAAPTFGSFEFNEGVMYAYYDLIGSLASENTMKEERSFKAYISVGEETVYSKNTATVSPKSILERMNSDISVFSETQREKMVGMIAKNSQLETPCSNFFGRGYELVTDASVLSVGNKIVITAKNANYALSTEDRGNNRGAVAITKDGSKLVMNSNVQILTLKEGTASGTFGFYTGSGYLYAASNSGNQLKTQNTNNVNGSWSISSTSDGVATIKAPGSSNRNWLRFNSSNTPVIFSCYTSGQTDVSVYKEVLTVACVTHTGGQASCTAPGSCSVCGKDYIPALTHTDGNSDHYCDYGCGTKLTDCEFDENHTCVCGETTDHKDATGDGKCDYCGISLSVSVVTKTETMSIYANKGSLANKVITWSGTNVTFQNAQDKSSSAIRTSDSDHHRVYASSKVIISGTNGAKITSVVITCTSSSYATVMKNGLTAAGYTATVSGSNVTVSVSSTESIEFNVTAQTRLNKVVITYEIEEASN